jgi:hypothetical protein
MLRQHRLAGIGLDLSGGDERRVARAEGFGHEARTLGTKRADARRRDLQAGPGLRRHLG